MVLFRNLSKHNMYFHISSPSSADCYGPRPLYAHAKLGSVLPCDWLPHFCSTDAPAPAYGNWIVPMLEDDWTHVCLWSC